MASCWLPSDTATSAHAMLVEMERRGMKPPRGAPMPEELHKLIVAEHTGVSEERRDTLAGGCKARECHECGTVNEALERRCVACGGRLGKAP